MGRKSITIDSEAINERTSAIREAAREFAANTAKAAKELLETTEKAAGKLEKRIRPEKKRGRKFLKLLVIGGIATTVVSNTKVREAISQQIRKLRGEDQAATSKWETPSTNGDFRPEPASATQES